MKQQKALQLISLCVCTRVYTSASSMSSVSHKDHDKLEIHGSTNGTKDSKYLQVFAMSCIKLLQTETYTKFNNMQHHESTESTCAN